MNPIRLLDGLIILGCLVLSSSCQTLPSSTNSSSVGATTRNYSDPSRKSWVADEPRPLKTMIWYPSDEDRRVSEQNIAIFKTGRYRFESKLSDARAKFPLIVVSHGTGGSAASIAWLCVKLASAGYIVAAVNHHGNTGAESTYLLEGFILWWERPADIRALIDRLLLDPVLGSRIDSERIGVAGFSIGGYTALATAGARLEIERWKSYCSGNESDPICHLPPEANYKMEHVWESLANNKNVLASLPQGNESYLGPRIRAAFVISPVLGPLITAESLQSIRIPVKLVVGSEDDQSVPSMNAIPFSKLIPENELEVLPGVTHYTFLSEGTWLGKIFAGKFFNDPKGIDRALVHETVGQEAIEFFDFRLKK